MPESNQMRETIFNVIENQIRDDTPPETKQTYDRLIAEGHTHDETMRLIGCVVSSEIFDVLKKQEPYRFSPWCTFDGEAIKRYSLSD